MKRLTCRRTIVVFHPCHGGERVLPAGVDDRGVAQAVQPGHVLFPEMHANRAVRRMLLPRTPQLSSSRNGVSAAVRHQNVVRRGAADVRRGDRGGGKAQEVRVQLHH